MKDIDIGKEYIIPSPGYRSVRERADSVQHEQQEESNFQHSKLKVSFFFVVCFAVFMLIKLHAAAFLLCQLCIDLLH